VAELAKLRFDGTFRQPADEALGFHSVANEVGYRNHLQVMAGTEFAELRHPRHGAVVVHDFADDAGGGQPGETGKVHGRLRLAGAHQHAAFPGAQGERHGRAAPGPRAGIRIDSGEDSAGAVGRGDAGGDACAGVDGFAKSGAEIGGVLSAHERQPEVVRSVPA